MRSERVGCAAGRRIAIAAGAIVLAVMTAASGASGQQPDAGMPTAPPASAGQGRACFQPAPLPVCRSFWVTEFGLQYFVSEPPGRVYDQRRVLVTWELGWMQNRSPEDALGGSVFLAANDNALRSGVRARYRRWTGGGTAVDVSPALILFESDDDMETHATLGAALQAGISLDDWLGLNTQVEATQDGVRFQAGVRLGRYPGAVTGVALPLVAYWHARHDPS